MRTGDTQQASLSLWLEGIEGLQAKGTQAFARPAMDPTPQFNILAEARLDLPHLKVFPLGEVTEPVGYGESTRFYWRIRSEKSGSASGILWLHLRLVPVAGGAERRYLVTAQQINLCSVGLFGLTGSAARLLGGIGILATSAYLVFQAYTRI